MPAVCAASARVLIKLSIKEVIVVRSVSCLITDFSR